MEVPHERDKNTKVIAGFTGSQGTFHSEQAIEYGTQMVGEIGQTHLGLPVFNTVAEAVAETGATASVIYVPAAFCILHSHAADAGIELIVCITGDSGAGYAVREGIHHPQGRCAPDRTAAGCDHPASADRHHPVTSISRVKWASSTGTLTYEAVNQTTKLGFGQSTCIGGDPIPGMTFIDALELFQNDPQTEAIVMVGELAVPRKMKPLRASRKRPNRWSLHRGVTAPPGKRWAMPVPSSPAARAADEKFAALEAGRHP